MKCKKMQERLSAFIDGELEEKERAEIEKHLANCAVCNQELKVLTKMWNALGVWEKMEVTPDFEMEFWQKIKEREQSQVIFPKIWGRIIRIPLPAAAAIILIPGILIGSYLGNSLYTKLSERELWGSREEMVVSELGLNNFDDLPEGSVGKVYIGLGNPKGGE